jgi:low temperature requirement protein LtrA
VPRLRPQNRVEYFELFFDLVFVFTLLQISRTVTSDGTIVGIVHGTVDLILLWWVWVAFTSLANMGLDSDERRDLRPVVFAVAMGLVLLMALAIPEAFWSDSKLFAYSYLGLALLAMGCGMWILRRHHDLTRAMGRMWLLGMVLPILVVVTSYVPNQTVSVVLIAIGICSSIAVPFAAGSAMPISTSHLSERYSLFILITLGESIISIGEGAMTADFSPLLVACVLIALALVVILWRHYYVSVLQPGESALHRLHGPQLTAFARYGYTFGHLFMVWGVLLIAVAIKASLVDLTTPLNDVLEAGLPAGALVFLATTVAFSRLAGAAVRPLTVVSLVLLAILLLLGPQMQTAVLLVAVTIAAALGIDVRALGMRKAVQERVPSPGSPPS